MEESPLSSNISKKESHSCMFFKRLWSVWLEWMKTELIEWILNYYIVKYLKISLISSYYFCNVWLEFNSSLYKVVSRFFSFFLLKSHHTESLFPLFISFLVSLLFSYVTFHWFTHPNQTQWACLVEISRRCFLFLLFLTYLCK